MDRTPFIAGEKVKLYPIEPSDTKFIRDSKNKKRVRQYMVFQPGPTTKEKEESERQKYIDDKTQFRFLIGYKNERAGIIKLNCDDLLHKASLGVWLDTGYWGQGLAKEATNLVIEYAFSELDLHRVEAWAYEGNPSNEILREVGFEKEGEKRQSAYIEGEYVNANLYGLLQDEWG